MYMDWNILNDNLITTLRLFNQGKGLNYEVIDLESEFDFLHNHVCWVHKDEFIFSDNIIRAIYNEKASPIPPTGTYRSATLLYEYLDSDEKKLLILLKMFIVQIESMIVNQWKPEAIILFREFRKLVLTKYNELNIKSWSGNVKKPMPSLLSEEYFIIGNNDKIYLEPNTIDELLNLFVLEITHLFSNYQLVNIIDPSYQDKRNNIMENWIKFYNQF